MSEIQNNSNSTIGTVSGNGEIKNNSGSTVGYVNGNGEVKNNSNSTIGTVNGSGEIKNNSGSTIGTVSKSGEVKNNSGSTIGYVRGGNVLAGGAGLLLLLKSNGNNDGCYIATAVYGSYDAPEVLCLRRFRDETLSSYIFGRLFIKCYYFLSPPIAGRLKNTYYINSFVRKLLNIFVH